METRTSIPSGLRLVVTDAEIIKSGNDETNKLLKSTIKVEEDEQEKPSSSSGHCETRKDHQKQIHSKSRRCKEKHKSSSCEGDETEWKKEQQGQFKSFSTSSSSSSLSPTTSDSSSSSDNEAEIDYFMKTSRKSDSSCNQRKKECDDDKNKRKANSEEMHNRHQSHTKICATRVIEKGTVFTPNDGDVQVVYLKGIPEIPKDDRYFICNTGDLDNAHARHGKKRSMDDDGANKEFSGANGEGPLDLSKLPAFDKNHKTTFNEPLKIGTPFDSPDSNDYDLVKRMTPPVIEGGSSSLFAIKNVLKNQSSETRCKLFQPYSLEIGKKSPDKDAFVRALITPNLSSSFNSAGPLLVTPPSDSDLPSFGRKPGMLRPILRTRGRERSLLPCEVCGKAFDRPSLLKRHLRTHTGEKPHICDVCSKGFSTSSSLNTHRRIHSGEKPHQCPICGKRFTASSNLYYHRMTHNKEKPHKCMLCGKSFPTPGDLKSHQYVHSGSWPYTCPVCQRGFSKQTNLRNHLLLHSSVVSNSCSSKAGDKPHTCQICDKKFAQACSLRAHVKTHEEPDPMSCSICKRTFLPTSNMLLNGRCPTCQLRLPTSKNSDIFTNIRRESTSTSPVGSSCMNTSATEMVKDGFSSSYDSTSLLSHRIMSQGNANQQQPLAPPIGNMGLPLSQFPGLSIPGLSNALGFPNNAASLHFPVNVHPTTSGATDLFGNASSQQPTRNALFDTLVEWNYRMAKESVGIGSLGFSIMQQKLLESQSRILAAQFMNTHGFGMGGGMQDILGLRSATTQEGFSSLDSNENKFLQR